MKKHSVHIVSLGCPKNLVDTEVISGNLLKKGIGLSADPDSADVFLVNTCAFLSSARDEASEWIQKGVNWKKKSPRFRRIVVSGCVSEWDRTGEFRKKYPEVDIWSRVDDIGVLGEKIEKLFMSGKETSAMVPPCSKAPEFLYDEKTPRLQLTPRHYAYLKISDGCSNRCSYCLIPEIRGKLRSRTVNSILKEAENLISNGVYELILIAQDTTAFGLDAKSGHDDICTLLEKLDSIKKENFKIRLMYTHPAHITGKLLDIVKNASHIMPYLDIPLQHISDRILKRMKRKISGDEIRSILHEARKTIPGLAIRTTFITGFPGEQESDSQELQEFVAKEKFERLGAFAYSPEPGTESANFTDQIPLETAEKRRDAIMELQAGISLKANKKLVGRNFDVIIDDIDNDAAYGRTYMDAPEIDNSVTIRQKTGIEKGTVIKCRITGAEEYNLHAIQCYTPLGRHVKPA